MKLVGRLRRCPACPPQGHGADNDASRDSSYPLGKAGDRLGKKAKLPCASQHLRTPLTDPCDKSGFLPEKFAFAREEAS